LHARKQKHRCQQNKPRKTRPNSNRYELLRYDEQRLRRFVDVLHDSLELRAKLARRQRRRRCIGDRRSQADKPTIDLHVEAEKLRNIKNSLFRILKTSSELQSNK
jgi:hypothetical protein